MPDGMHEWQCCADLRIVFAERAPGRAARVRAARGRLRHAHGVRRRRIGSPKRPSAEAGGGRPGQWCAGWFVGRVWPGAGRRGVLLASMTRDSGGDAGVQVAEPE